MTTTIRTWTLDATPTGWQALPARHVTVTEREAGGNSEWAVDLSADPITDEERDAHGLHERREAELVSAYLDGAMTAIANDRLAPDSETAA